jgi:RNA-directed DNA polymerase
MIKEKFRSVENIDEFVFFLNTEINPNDISITKTQIESFISFRQDAYKSYFIPKKKSGIRRIDAPIYTLKNVQRKIQCLLELFYEPKDAIHGFVKNRSIISNAECHVGKKSLLNIDVRDFFPSIKKNRVQAVLELPPFKFNPIIAHAISGICTYYDALPQGAPTSPILSNIICQRLDRKLVQFAREERLYYTRYADDLSFSSYRSNLNLESLTIKITQILKKEGFLANENKIRLLRQNERQVVTGLVVNEKVNINRKYVKHLRAVLHSWENEGYLVASSRFFNNIQKKYNKPKFQNVLKGKIEYIGSIKGITNKVYQNLIKKFDLLVNLDQTEIFSLRKSTKLKKPKFHAVLRTVYFLNNLQKEKHFNNLLSPHETLIQDLNKDLQNAKFPPYIPHTLIRHINNKLIDLYQIKGLLLWEKEKKHPMTNSSFNNDISNFIKSYNFGLSSEKLTSFSDMIYNIIKSENGLLANYKIKYNDSQVQFFPEISMFDQILTFKTLVRNIEIGIENIFESIILHTNLKGRSYFEFSKKQIKIKAQKHEDREGRSVVIVQIIDIDSYAICNPERLLTTNSTFEETRDQFRSFCDWKIHAYFPNEDKYLTLTILSADKFTNENVDISDCKSAVEGFTHELIFYLDLSVDQKKYNKLYMEYLLP